MKGLHSALCVNGEIALWPKVLTVCRIGRDRGLPAILRWGSVAKCWLLPAISEKAQLAQELQRLARKRGGLAGLSLEEEDLILLQYLFNQAQVLGGDGANEFDRWLVSVACSLYLMLSELCVGMPVNARNPLERLTAAKELRMVFEPAIREEYIKRLLGKNQLTGP